MLRTVSDSGKRVVEKGKQVFGQAMVFFKKPAPVPQYKLHTRFTSARELQEVADQLDKIAAKREQLHKIAIENGDESNEAAARDVLQQLLNIVREQIDKFNQQPGKADMRGNIVDMFDLTEGLKEAVKVASAEQAVINSVTLDKPFVKNTAITAGVLAAPSIPLLMMSPPLGILYLGASSYFMAKPTSDLLEKAKIINWDTESKELVQNFINAVEAANASLRTELAKNEPAAVRLIVSL